MKKAIEHKQRPLEESDAKLEKKADELERFDASQGWMDRFKHRHSIVFKGNQGEAAEIDLKALGDWQQDVLRETISHLSADDVFNVDETGLFWQVLPNKTLAFKGKIFEVFMLLEDLLRFQANGVLPARNRRSALRCLSARTCLERRNCRCW